MREHVGRGVLTVAEPIALHGTTGETSFAVTHHLACHPRSLLCVPLCYLRRHAASPCLLRCLSALLSLTATASGSVRRTAQADHRNPAGHRRDLHPHRHPQQQWQRRQSKHQQHAVPAARDGVATSSGAPVVGGITGASTTIITAEDLSACAAIDAAGHPVARSRHPDHKPLWRRERHRHGGGHARLRRHRAVERARAGRWAPLQRLRHPRLRFQSDSRSTASTASRSPAATAAACSTATARSAASSTS